MDAPRSLRRRLCDAAEANDLAQLAWLRNLNMAEESDYLAALPSAIRSKAVQAFAYLCQSIQLVSAHPAQNDLDEKTKVDIDNRNLDVGLSRAIVPALRASSVDFCMHLVRCKPSEFLRQVRNRTSSQAYSPANLVRVLRIDTDEQLYTPEERKQLLDATLTTVLASTSPVYEHMAELVHVHGARITLFHAREGCKVIDQMYESDCLCLRRLMNDFILPSLDAEQQRILLFGCCSDYGKGRALRLLLSHYKVDDRDATFAKYASKYGAWRSLEVCLDLLPWQSDQAELFLNNLTATCFSVNDPVAAGKVLALLLSHTPDASLPNPSGHHRTNFNVMYLYLIEAHLQRKKRLPATWSFAWMNFEELKWLWRRNPEWRGRITTGAATFVRLRLLYERVRQDRIHASILASTPLALVLVDLVCELI
jgi:hypothetical protein